MTYKIKVIILTGLSVTTYSRRQWSKASNNNKK